MPTATAFSHVSFPLLIPAPSYSLTHRKQDGRIPRISDEINPFLPQSHPLSPRFSFVKGESDMHQVEGRWL
ncbi:hypothetical protein GOODEAATRI_027767 [Goodea atripinnis]|uniref:Uncharacterized protein n=1 Tax=Goodea atripinnis TaxID=208336 RepID=A0ABV0MX40_9TELE